MGRWFWFKKRKVKTTKEKHPYKYYKSCKFLPKGCFDERIRTNDNRWLLKLDDYEYLPKCSKELEEELERVWDNIKIEYFDMQCESGIYKIALLRKANILKLENEYKLFKVYVFTLRIEYNDGIAKKLMAKGYRINPNGDISKQLDIVEKQLENYKNKIKKAQESYDQLFSEEANKSATSDAELLDIVATNKGRHINKFEITVEDWIAMIKNISKQKKHGGHKST